VPWKRKTGRDAGADGEWVNVTGPLAPPPPDVPVDALTGMAAARTGLYVHFPWCLAKCPYCDFAVAVAKAIPGAKYRAALEEELALRLEAAPGWAGRTLDSVYLGGGTPSLWEPAEVGKLLQAVARALPLRAGAEVTLEANPEVADTARLEGYRAAGVNRLSLGVQSFSARTLKALGRAHGPAEGQAAVAAARAAGFENVSLDVILGVEGQSLGDVLEDARAATALEPEHLSAYVLTVERDALAAETVFSRRLRTGRLQLPADGVVADMLDGVADVLGAAGLVRYEISNYARPGKHARHNTLYWTGGEYLALGVGATGAWREGKGALRVSAHRSTVRWFSDVAAGRLPEAERELLGKEALFAERLMLGLRLTSGLDVAQLTQQAGQPSRAQQLAALEAQGLGETGADGRFRLSRRGLLLHSEVCARLL
jgi:putative oxygen-independent coproporphyrinogen III oxidase